MILVNVSKEAVIGLAATVNNEPLFLNELSVHRYRCTRRRHDKIPV